MKLKGVAWGKSYLFFFLPYHSLFQKVLICPLIRVGSDSMDIWRSTVRAKNGLKMGQKYSTLSRILKKMTFKSLLLFTVWQIYLKIWTKVLLKSAKNLIWASFWIFLFLHYLKHKNLPNSQFLLFLALHTAKKAKIHNMLPLSFFGLKRNTI